MNKGDRVLITHKPDAEKCRKYGWIDREMDSTVGKILTVYEPQCSYINEHITLRLPKGGILCYPKECVRAITKEDISKKEITFRGQTFKLPQCIINRLI